jgi:hypothetical protein
MTVTTQEIRTTLTRYLERHPDEASELQPLRSALNSGADLSSRSEFNGGHVTCGAVVLGLDGRLLLIRHKALKMWLLPGGHLESSDEGLLPQRCANWRRRRASPGTMPSPRLATT